MGSKPNITIPPAAGYLLYRAYKNGTFDSLKDRLFGKNDHNFEPTGMSSNHSANAEYLGAAIPDGTTIEIEQADTIHGLPAQNVTFDPSVYQFYNDTCAIQSQHLILQQYGINVTQEELIELAKENGWYAEGYGTPKEMVGKLLEHYGIDIHASQGNNIFNLANELAQGHQIIVGVDELELVFPEQTQDWDAIYGEQGNHALVVVGIDTSDPGNVQVIVTDPATGSRQMAFPAEQFIDAWKDSNCFMVATESVPDDSTGNFTHLDNFAGIPIDNLNRLSDMDIDIESSDSFNNFVEDVLNNSSGLDDLITQYSDLFDMNYDDVI